MMICLPNINRAAENEYQKLNKQWAVFQEVQRTSGYFAAKSLEPKTKRRELFEFKEDERANYINKEKEKLVYAVTDGGGFIVLSFFMALISIMSFYVKPKDEPLEENY
ncbi:MAG: hypothetical protein J5706_04390 [Elusimicrobiales bacterium]|nr:hypothetical protein [Elusimicrobiales bacterium]